MSSKGAAGKGSAKVTFADRQKGVSKSAPDAEIEGRRRSLAADATSAATDFVLPKPDTHRQSGQVWGVISVCAPEGTRVRSKKVAVKVSGSFATEEEANKAAEIIRNEDTRFDVSVFPLYEWGTVPISADVKPLVRKEYTNKYMTKVMGGLQASLIQSRKEMDDRIARDRAKSEMEMRKKLGPDYVAPEKKPDKVQEYEDATLEREEKTKDMRFTQRELIDSFAKYMSSGCPGGAKIDPQAAGNFIRFMEAQKMAEKQFEQSGDDVETVAVLVGDKPPTAESEAPQQ